MSVKFYSKITRVLYQNWFCEQEDFDVIVSGTTDVLKHSEERTSCKQSSNEFLKVETVYHSKRHSCSYKTVC